MQSTGVWSLNHHITTSLGLSPTPIFLKSIPDLHRRNGIRVDAYTHPQHIKVLKHFIYIQDGYGMLFIGVLSLNHHITTLLGLSPTPIFHKSILNLHRHNGIMVDPYAHSQHIKMLRHFLYIQYGCGMQSEASCSLNHHNTTSLGLSHNPKFQNLATPHPSLA